MIDMNRDNSLDRYIVRLGHNRVSVEGRSHDEAIEQARRALSLDMPRLYDVIYGLDRTSFDVCREV